MAFGEARPAGKLVIKGRFLLVAVCSCRHFAFTFCRRQRFTRQRWHCPLVALNSHGVRGRHVDHPAFDAPTCLFDAAVPCAEREKSGSWNAVSTSGLKLSWLSWTRQPSRHRL
jgi:hypothetical protein